MSFRDFRFYWKNGGKKDTQLWWWTKKNLIVTFVNELINPQVKEEK